MGKMREKTKPLQPNCNGCKESEELICRYNARVFDPCVYLRVCYCGENFKRTWVPDEALGECRFALDYHIPDWKKRYKCGKMFPNGRGRWGDCRKPNLPVG